MIRFDCSTMRSFRAIFDLTLILPSYFCVGVVLFGFVRLDQVSSA
jgi:hypothetical protein